jgi:CBS-domain-containing membrane protein
MKASDIMSSPAITVGPQTPISDIAALLAGHRISAVPVVEHGRLVGIVSEADLLHRHEIGTDRTMPAGPGWLRLFNADSSAAEYTRSHAVHARDIMTRKVVSIAADAAVGEIVALLEKRKVKRLPVLRGHELVGIVSRADVVRALAAKARSISTAQPGDDEAIQAGLVAELERQPWWRSPYSSVRVSDGVVHYLGIIDSYDERDAARVAAENVPGVRGVEDHRFTMYDIPSMV